MWYAQIDDAGFVQGLSDLAGEVQHPHLIPITTWDSSLIGQCWDGATFAPVAVPPKPRLRVIADKTRIWERTPGQPPDSDQVAILTGQLLDADGQPDPTATLPETVIELPSADGQPSLTLIRASAGVVEISLRGQWSQSIPFITQSSGRYNIGDLLRPYFDVVDAPVIEVLRG